MNDSATDTSAFDERVDSAIADYLDAVKSDYNFDEKQFIARHSDVAPRQGSARAGPATLCP